MTDIESLRIAFIHPDLGIGGAERLVVDAALGLQNLGHHVDIYTSYHDPSHCFEETRDGTLHVHNIVPPFPRSFRGKFHILFAHLRQLHLTTHLLRTNAETYDVFFVDQLSTCVPFLRAFAHKRVVFYCHFPDKLLANGEFVGAAEMVRPRGSVLKRLYRIPMDWLEEKTTGAADVLLANSEFTAGVFNAFFSIPQKPQVVYPGINLSAYDPPPDLYSDKAVMELMSDRPTLLSLNRFEKKKNAALAIKAFLLLREAANSPSAQTFRLVLGGGYDPRLEDNVETLKSLVRLAAAASVPYFITSPSALPSSASASIPSSTASSPATASILLVLNFTTPQRTALLHAPSTRALLYTPAHEHFGIVPVEGMAARLPVLACDSGGPTESVRAAPPEERTGWLVPPDPVAWAHALQDIVSLDEEERSALGERARRRAETMFGMEAMALGIQDALYDARSMGTPDGLPIGDIVMVVTISLLAYLTYWLLL